LKAQLDVAIRLCMEFVGGCGRPSCPPGARDPAA